MPEAGLESARYRRDLLAIYHRAIESVDGRRRVAERLRAEPPPGPVCVFAVGKAAAHMTAGACDALGEAIAAGLLITKHGHLEPGLVPSPRVHGVEASHPVPDESSLAAGEALVEFLESAPSDAALISLISGGASSLVEVLPEGLGAEGLSRLNRWLLASGLAIDAMNRVRKRVSRVKGGRLAAWVAGRPTLNLLISDVPGDDPKVIGSGLLVAHRAEDLSLRGIDTPGWLQDLLERAPPLPDPAAFSPIRTEIIARPVDAQEAAARAGEAAGYPVYRHSELLTGDAVEQGRRVIREAAAGARGLHVWMGETTVRLPEQPGRGGRCQSLALAAAIEVRDHPGILLLAAGTDGTDGPGEDAGALVDSETVRRGALAGLDAEGCLRAADAGSYLEASGDLVHTGPTGTNVMDVVLALKTT